MQAPMRPRKIAGWEFFDDHPDVCDVVRPGGLKALGEDDRQVAEWFAGAVGGSRKVMDLGCGSGFPGLYVAPHVGQWVGVDAAPRMIAAARSNAHLLGVANVDFHVAGRDRLPFPDECFDGLILCGVLESMDWESVHRIVPEVRRVTAPGAALAVLDQEWDSILRTRPPREMTVRTEGEQLLLRCVERFPHAERDTRYVVDPMSRLGHVIREHLGDWPQAPIAVDLAHLVPEEILDTWYDEAAQFDERSLRALLAAHGFGAVNVDLLHVWGQNVLVATATG